MNFILLTLFPEMFPGSLGFSLAGKALKNNLWSYNTINIRDFGLGKHSQIDDKKFGGGCGLVMRADVLGNALDHIYSKFRIDYALYPSVRGINFSDNIAKQVIDESKEDRSNILILCGRFEGIDQRIIDYYQLQEVSIGNYILSGGEVAAITIMDVLIRLVPGVIKNADTIKYESLSNDNNGLLECDIYTRPNTWKGKSVPTILASGHAAKIKEWELKNAQHKTNLKLDNCNASIVKQTNNIKDHDIIVN